MIKSSSNYINKDFNYLNYLNRFSALLAMILFIVSFSSCDTKSKKQFELGKRYHDDRLCEEAIKTLSVIDEKSSYYNESCQLLYRTYRELWWNQIQEQKWDEAIETLDTLPSKHGFYKESQFLMNIASLEKILSTYVSNKEGKNIDESVMDEVETRASILKQSFDTMTVKSDYYEITKDLILAAYGSKALYYFDKNEYKKSLDQFSNIDLSIYDTIKTNALYDLIGRIQYKIAEEKRQKEIEIALEKRQNDIHLILTLTSNICDKDYFDNLHNSDDPLDLVSELQEFQEYWKMIDKMGDSYSDDEVVFSHVKKLQSELIRVQKREFPILRKQVAKLLSQKLWLDNIDVYCSGNRNSTISFVGFGFASNAYVAQAQNSFELIFKEFKFKKSHYHWYRGSEYVSFNIDSSDDSERVYVYGNF